ncbi:AMIN domain-containing protein [Stenomitos frigidus]|uniref:AMIN domain-containing protein n=1 Tax=Stenomitos frigidus TaxID=1886765 RepID=UPI0011B1F521|nr:AMIN domain-containing protein [Stenomitos frigidus]
MQRHTVVISQMLLGAAAIALVAQPASALTQVTGLTLNPTASGIDIVLQLQAAAQGSAGDKPQVFTSGQGNTWVANITKAQLSPATKPYRQDNPAPGIATIVMANAGANSIQVTVTSKPGSLMGQAQQEGTKLTLSLLYAAANGTAATNSNPPVSGASVNVPPQAQASPSATTTRTPPATSATPAVAPVPAPTRSPTPVATPSSTAAPTPQPLPTPLPRPPIPATPSAAQSFNSPTPQTPLPSPNKITYTDLSVQPTTIDLGTAARIERVVLRETPVREALALLARAADLGIVYAEDLGVTATPGAPAQAAGSVIDSNISLDIENEPIQDVFNYILRAKGLKANRVGKTIFVGLNLPATTGSYVTRTLRLNQMRATLPQTNLTTTATSTSSLTSGGGQGGSTTTSQVGRNSTTTENIPYKGALQVLEELGVNNSPTARSPVFRGLQVTADARTNTLSIVGSLEQVQLATDYLNKLDVRRKQVAVNVKIVEVDLSKTSNIGSSFSFGVAGNFFNVNQGRGGVNVGPVNPSLIDSNSLTSPSTIANPFATVQPPLNTNAQVTDSRGNTLGFQPASPINSNPLAPVVTNLTGGSVVSTNSAVTTVLNQALTYGLPPLFQFPMQFLLNLQAQVVSGNAKILTDPTLIVQEGNQSQVNLTSQVFSGFTEQRVTEGNVTSTRILPQPPIDVGVILNVQVDQIDDNNFVTIAVSPEVSSLGQQITDPSRNNLLIQQLVNRRRLETGKIRLRDGQTLILTGIIQEQDREIITKVPILGDIPLLNLLFRNRRLERSRNEVVVLVTPQILDDSDRSPYGYNYLPGPEVEKYLRQRTPQPAPSNTPAPSNATPTPQSAPAP